MVVVRVEARYIAMTIGSDDGMFACRNPMCPTVRNHQTGSRDSCVWCGGTGDILPNPTGLDVFVDDKGNIAEELTGNFRHFPLSGLVDKVVREWDPHDGFPGIRNDVFDPLYDRNYSNVYRAKKARV